MTCPFLITHRLHALALLLLKFVYGKESAVAVALNLHLELVLAPWLVKLAASGPPFLNFQHHQSNRGTPSSPHTMINTTAFPFFEARETRTSAELVHA